MSLRELIGHITHHAYLLIGNQNTIMEELPEVLEEELEFTIRGNPDYWNSTYESFSIDDVRALKEVASRKAFGKKKIIIISFATATHEAQNALLKLLEEPVPHTYFFLITERSESLLPTLRSRVYVVESFLEQKNSNVSVKKFLESTHSERLKEITPLIEAGDKMQVLAFLNNLEAALSKDKNLKTSHPQIFEDIFKARKYLYDRAPSIKMLLEHMVMIVSHI